ncbi:cation:proton antiporter [Pseudomonas sp.]|uniref:cation:proton antiporter n=1 Tax=Pseudomonas sp. TaxID=306 RepID=UPI002915056C|nr:cation:proton antiporter [Pseudomonas sp.]MDU4251116.1 cation:proton antiporter [Pseudomonas sp.]
MPHTPFLVQLLVILAVARALGILLRALGQPTVIGEMLAGIMLGPIILGALAPQIHAALFEASSLPALSALSQLGLVLFMFVVGAELRAPDGVRNQLRSASIVGTLSVLLPIVLGILISVLLHPSMAPPGVGLWPFALFMSAAMSITAFPVMARILKERGQSQTRMGQLAMTSAALADVLAWIVLAIVVALNSQQSGALSAWQTTLGLAALIGVVFVVLKPLCAWVLRSYCTNGQPDLIVLTFLVLGALGCAALTQWMGVHAVFGAFLFGVCLPRDDRLLANLVERLEYPTLALLMPVFFALAGLSTRSEAFTVSGLGALLLVLAAAILGKVLGGAAGARLARLSWRDSFALGSLMNARGLMELIVMKVGLDAGLIGPEMFTLLLLMAIITTMMTGPLLSLFSERNSSPITAGKAGTP